MKNITEQLTEAAQAADIVLTPSQVTALAAHTEMVLEQNKTMNLTTIPEDQVVGLHILDSLSALAALNAAPEGPFADLGAGAGYPGIPLSIVTGREVALVESVRKKAAFLQRTVAELCLKATVHPIRAEELALERKAAYAAVVARALSSLPSLVELAAPLLKTDGVLICLKGTPDEEELRRGDLVARRCGMKRESTESVVVPLVDAQRTMIVYRKTGPASAKLPRRPGMAQRQPLA